MVFQLAALSVFSFVLLVICDKGKKLFGPALFRTIRFSMLSLSIFHSSAVKVETYQFSIKVCLSQRVGKDRL